MKSTRKHTSLAFNGSAGIAGLVIVLVALTLTVWVPGRRTDGTRRFTAERVIPDGYRLVTGPEELTFPFDHGPHPDFLTEWWYFTGNLDSTDGNHFGYQLTFFRRSLAPPVSVQPRTSDWAASQIYMAHIATTDVSAQSFVSEERFSRGGADLAGAQSTPFKVWLDDLTVTESGTDRYLLSAATNNVSLALTLQSEMNPLLNGERGFSKKGPATGNASMYYSLTRLASTGQLKLGTTTYDVDGLSWMDHEFSTNALSSNQIGWDWFSMQLKDGTDLMLFQIRRQDGSSDPYSAGTITNQSDAMINLSSADFTVHVLKAWHSPHSGATYPAAWAVTIPSAGLSLRLDPYVADQELNLTFTYWEGAVRINGVHAGLPVSGSGYIELTGYASPFTGDF